MDPYAQQQGTAPDQYAQRQGLGTVQVTGAAGVVGDRSRQVTRRPRAAVSRSLLRAEIARRRVRTGEEDDRTGVRSEPGQASNLPARQDGLGAG